MNRLVAIVERTAGTFLLLIAMLTFGTVVLRYLFATQIPDWFDISKFLQGIAIFWGIAVVCYRNEHILVDVVWEKCNTKNRRRIDIFATLIVVVFLALCTYMMAAKVWQVIGSGQATSDLRLPVAPFHVVAWLGLVLATVLSALRLLHLIQDIHPDSESNDANDEKNFEVAA